MKSPQLRKASVEVRKLSFVFLAMIRIAFGNEASSTPKLIWSPFVSSFRFELPRAPKGLSQLGKNGFYIFRYPHVMVRDVT